MTRLWIVLLALPLCGGTLPGRYMVVLTGESAAQLIVRTVAESQRHASLLGQLGQDARARVRRAQAPVGRGTTRCPHPGFGEYVGERVFRRDSGRQGRATGGRARGAARDRGTDISTDFGPCAAPAQGAAGLEPGWCVCAGCGDASGHDRHRHPDHTPWIQRNGLSGACRISGGWHSQRPGVHESKGDCGAQLRKPVPVDRSGSFGPRRCGTWDGNGDDGGGVENTGPLATITGVAPQAYLGNYKVFGSPGINDSTNSCAIESALEDAVNDGMDVVNLSLGAVPAPRLADDPEVQAIEAAAAMGVIVAIAGGNNGPDPNTIGSPGTAPSAITLGAMNNDRYFAAPFRVGSNGPYAAIPGAERFAGELDYAPLVDISSKLDSTGLACNPLPANSLTGDIALILRGTCTFEVKLDHAQQAGAVAALIYTYSSSPDAIVMAVGTATLPAEMVSNQDGLTIKQLVASPAKATMSFTQAAFATDPNRIAGFSSLGPSVDLSIKPDLLAVGENFYTAAQSTDPSGRALQCAGLCGVARHQLLDAAGIGRGGRIEGGAARTDAARIQIPVGE